MPQDPCDSLLESHVHPRHHRLRHTVAKLHTMIKYGNDTHRRSGQGQRRQDQTASGVCRGQRVEHDPRVQAVENRVGVENRELIRGPTILDQGWNIERQPALRGQDKTALGPGPASRHHLCGQQAVDGIGRGVRQLGESCGSDGEISGEHGRACLAVSRLPGCQLRRRWCGVQLSHGWSRQQRTRADKEDREEMFCTHARTESKTATKRETKQTQPLRGPKGCT